MELPTDLQFSQASLQDYVDCARRFQLRYVLNLRWPAVETAPALRNERRVRQGSALHRLIRQHLVGIPVEILSRSIADDDVRIWWENYLESRPAARAVRRHPEVTLSSTIGQWRMAARYDLVGVDEEGNVLIFDWKTHRRRPERAWLSERLQTRVYPYVLTKAWEGLDARLELRPARVVMVYWFAEFPSVTVDFEYDEAQFRGDGEYLRGLVESIVAQVRACGEKDLLPRTDETDRCRFCRYRSLCRRGVEPGEVPEEGTDLATDDLSDFSLDFDQRAEFEIG